MNNITSHTGTLLIVRRLTSSINGNPRYQITIGGEACATGVDSSHGYSVTNYDGKPVRATIGTHYGVRILESIESGARS